MNLFQKSLVFLAVVVVIQAALFFGFSSVLSRAERESQQAEQSRLIVTHTAMMNGLLEDLVVCLVVWGVTQSSAAEREFQHIIDTRTHEAVAEQNQVRATDEESRLLLRKLDAQVAMILEEIKRVHDTCIRDTSFQQILILRRVFRNEVEPLLGDLKSISAEILKKHGSLAQQSAVKDAEFRESTKRSLSAFFMVNILLMMAIVIGFSKGVTSRLSVIADNVSRFWRGRELNEPLSGKDEISSLDGNLHEMSKALSEAREKEQAILRNMPIGLFVCSQDGLIESVNSKAESLFVHNVESFTGRQLSEFIVEPDFSFATLETAELPRVWTVKCASGEFPAELSISRFHHSGQVKYLLSVMDVTAREQVDRLKQEFVSVVSHDIRTPLTSIQINSELLSSEAIALSETGKRAVQNIQRNSTRLLALTKDLLLIAKMESANIQLDCRDVDTTALFEKSLSVVETAAETKGVKLECRAIDRSVYCDEDRMVQVLINLLANAVKFSDEGQTIWLSAVSEGEMIKISVKDEGVGIKAEDQKVIFERFKQARAADSAAGTGLGLAISKMLVAAHGGSIGVESQLGSGSTFWVRLSAGQAK